MIKLYVFYLVFGLYMFFETLIVWQFRDINGGDTWITYLSMLSSGVLLSIATGLLLYKPQGGLLLGLIALIGVFPFGIHWLNYRYTMEAPIISGGFNQIVLLATALYVLGLLYSIKRMIRYKQSNNDVIVKKSLKLFLTFFPASILVILIVWM